VHFPEDADVDGEFENRVAPVSMDAADKLSYGEAQTAAVAEAAKRRDREIFA
jgi:hypothetical protein